VEEEKLLITYNLKGKTSIDKVKFSQALYGRRKEKGVLKKLKGESLGKGAIVLPLKQREKINEFLIYWKILFKEKGVKIYGLK